jgi:hypothetical protein
VFVKNVVPVFIIPPGIYFFSKMLGLGEHRVLWIG